MKLLKFLNLRAAVALTAGVAAALSVQAAEPRYIFYFIGDGMGMGQVMSARTYAGDVLGRPEAMVMMQFPFAGMLETRSASSTVTDSAAAGTALACGKKTDNGMLGVESDTTSVSSIATILHDAGWGVGLVTSVAPDDATPGAFYAHVPSRGMFAEIGRHAAESGFEFIGGSAWRGLSDSEGKSTGVAELFEKSGIHSTTSLAEAAASDSRRVFLTAAQPFTDGNIGFTIDSIPTAITLPDMTAACLAHLERVSPERFFMMVEGGNIDHVGHSNDGATVAVEVVNFNDALRHAYEFYQRHPEETVIIVTADHETGGMSLGNRHVGYTSHTEYIPYQRMSKDNFARSLKQLRPVSGEFPSWDEVKEFTAANTGLWRSVPVSEKQEKHLREIYDNAVAGNAQADERTLYATADAFTSEVFRVLNDIQGFGWTTGSHTGNPVPVYAIGEGMEQFGTLRDNTTIAPALLRLAGFGE